MKIDVYKQIKYWLKTAKDDFETALLIFNGGINYHHSCFFRHLVIEKTLKALVVNNTKKHPPYSHDLILLADKAGLTLDDNLKEFLELLNRFVIEARYPDEKFEFFKLATKQLAESCIKKTKTTQNKIIKLLKQ